MYAFANCSSLTMIELPAGFDEALLRSASLPAQAVLRYAPAFPIDANGHVDVPSAVVRLPRNAFRGSTSLRSIKLPAGLTQIGAGAFRDCSSLTSMTIPEGIMRSVMSTFFGCSSLTSVTIPEGVTQIGGGAFRGC